MVLRPDSGDPCEVVLQALESGEAVAGVTVNKKGFKVINGFSVIQGDGINYASIQKIIDTFLKKGYSASNVAFGMGAGLLQKVNRDTMSFATKLSYIKTSTGHRDVMKKPKSDPEKISLPGILKVKKVNGVPTVFPSTEDDKDPENIFQVVWDHGPVQGHKWDDFDTIRKNVSENWKQVPKLYDPISSELRQKIKKWIEEFEQNYDKLLKVPQ